MNPAGTGWKRWALLAAAGAATFVLAYRAVDGDAEVVQPAAHGAPGAGEPAAKGTAARLAAAGAEAAADPTSAQAPGLPARTKVTQSARSDPFAAKGWTGPASLPPSAPRATPAPPSAPTAPPVPFQFIGQIEDRSAKPAAFLTKGEALFVVHVGDVIENTYRVESFGAAQVVVTYLPLQQRQTIDVSGG